MTAWIFGAFVFKTSLLVHVLLVLSVIVYIQSILVRETGSYFFGGNKTQ